MAEKILIQTLILIFGMSFGFRIAGIATAKLNLKSCAQKKLDYVVIFLMVAVSFLCFNSVYMSWWTVTILIFVGLVTIFVTLHAQNKKFRQDFVFFVDKVILQIKIGRSLRAAMERSVQELPQVSKQTLECIMSAVFSNESWQGSSEFEEQVYNELSDWHGMNQKVLYRINEYRSQLRLEERFRRKSEQIIHQVKIQIWLLVIMYFLMMFFIFQRFSFYEHLSSVLVSILLFICGIFTFYYLTRRKIWRI